jgi:hypothetical protein
LLSAVKSGGDCHPGIQSYMHTIHCDSLLSTPLHKVWAKSVEAEMKEMLGNFADGQIELYRSVSDILVFLEPP